MTIRTIAVISLVLSFIQAFGAVFKGDKNLEIKKLERELSSIRTSGDSVKVLYDIFDLSDRKAQVDVAAQIYRTAMRDKDYTACLDMIRHLGLLLPSDSVMQILLKTNRSLPQSQERDETDIYLQMLKVARDSKYRDQKTLHKEVARLIAEEEKLPSTDPKRRVMRLYTLTEYLTNGVNGKLLSKYMNMLMEATEKANFKLYALKNLILTEVVNAETAVENHQRAIDHDRALLKVVDGLEKKYKDAGRKYRNYDVTRYVIYRRMLHNSESLTPQEVETVMNNIRQLGESNSDVRADMTDNPRYLLHYAMYMKDYATAKEAALKVLPKEKSIKRRRRILEDLRLSAEKTGDMTTLAMALAEYNNILRECDSLDSSEQFNELQVRFDVNELRARNTILELQSKEEQIAGTRRTMSLVLAGWLICAALLIFLLFYWRKYRRMTVNLDDLAKNLSRERDYLKKIRYQDKHSNPITHDSGSPTSARLYEVLSIKKSDQPVPRAIEYIINDILYISSIGKHVLDKFIYDVSVNNVVKFAESEASRLNEADSRVDVVLSDISPVVKIDRECFEYTVSRILRNALSLEKTGRVELLCRPSSDGSCVQLIYSSSDAIVKYGNEEIVFSDFINLDELAERKDSGMFICRLIAMLLHCTISFDPTCEKGSRCIFSVPYK